jgi:hypothetical protein
MAKKAAAKKTRVKVVSEVNAEEVKALLANAPDAEIQTLTIGDNPKLISLKQAVGQFVAGLNRQLVNAFPDTLDMAVKVGGLKAVIAAYDACR